VEHLAGAVVPLAPLAALARIWYAGRLDDDYVAPARDVRMQQLVAHGFRGKFWRLP